MPMRRILVILLLLAAIGTASAVSWYSINIDRKTAIAMAAAYKIEKLEEESSATALDSILSHYKKAGIAVAGIFQSKLNDRNAMRNPGLFVTEENYYYTRILRKVKDIMPKFISVASKMVKCPENAIYWGPYLCKTTQNVENLCKEFELVATNGKLSFKDVQFLLVNEDLRKVFELVDLGNVDWKSLLDKLGDFGRGLSREDLKEDMDKLGQVLAQAGRQTVDANLQKASRIGRIFHASTGEIKNLYGSFKNSYESLRNGNTVKDLLMQVIITPDAAGVARLFEVDDYNLTGYISNYIKELQGRYYTQRWYIYTEDSGRKVLCEFKPESYGNRDDSRWDAAWNHYVSPRDNEYCHTLTNAEKQQLKDKAERLCGWSQRKVDEYNRNNPGHNCYISYTLNHIDFRESYKNNIFGSRHYKRHCFYSYDVYVHDSWYIKHEVYEEVFDSQSMDKETFMKKMEARLRSYSDNLDSKDENYGVVYKLGSDAPRYYTMADQKKMEGCNSVSFIAKCHDGATLAEGAFNWKENGSQGKRLEDPKSKEFAMRNNAEETGGEKDLLDRQRQYTNEINALTNEISQNDSRMQALTEKIYQAKLANNTVLVKQLQQEYDSLSDKNAGLKAQLSEARNNLSQTNAALDEYYKDMEDNLDGPYRIPSNMTELQGMYQLQWQDEGEWIDSSEDFVFVRHAYCPSANANVTYTATLKLARKPKYFLGIRIHRAVLSVEFKLTSSTDSENVIEVMELDMSKSEQQRADEVNSRLKELMADMPDCTISVKYEYANDVEIQDDDDNAIHLLWASDRLDIARDVDYQLTEIYAQLVLLEKVMDYRLSLSDFLKRQILDVVSRSRRGTIAEYALQRWESASLAAMNKTNGTGSGGNKQTTAQ